MARRSVVAKLIATAAATVMIGSGLSACGGNDEAVDADGKPIVTILVAKNSNQAPMSKMTWAKELAEDAGVSIEWKEVSDDQ